MAKNYIIGESYFQLGFYDDKYKHPAIASFIYAGKDLDPNCNEEAWYFQDVESYLEQGPYSFGTNHDESENNIRTQIYMFDTETINEIFSLEELAEELLLYSRAFNEWKNRGRSGSD